jgi:type IV pilus assembly protein PilF
MSRPAALAPHLGARLLMGLLFVSIIFHLPLAGAGFPKVAESSQALTRAQARTALASAYFQAGMFVFALEEVDQALILAPQHAPALVLKALLFQQQNKTDLSQKYFQQAMAAAPQDPQVALQWGIFDCQNNHFEAAFEKFKRALDLSMGPLQVKTNWIWGQCLRRKQQFEAANERMSAAFAQQPGLIFEPLELVELKIQLGKLIEAEKILDYLNDYPSVSAQSVWLALQLAERQNHAVKKNHWGKMLGLHFSNSAQWRAYQEDATHD